MILTVKHLLDIADRAQPMERLSDPALETASPEEIDAAFEALDGLFSFNRWTGGLQVNNAFALPPKEHAVVQRLVDGFKERVHTGQIALERAPSGIFVPVPMEREIERGGLSNNPCHWHWCSSSVGGASD
jgi:hypothetical protein